MKIMIVDVHAHLDHQALIKNMPEIIARAKEAGVKKIITNGINSATNRISLDLAKKYDIVEAALGWYPRDALSEEELGLFKDSKLLDIEEELEFIKKQNFIALGEVGLDLKHGKDIKIQQEDFQKFIELSEKTKKPLIVHSRKAELQAIEQLESSKAKIVMHCFGGKHKLAKRIADNGWSFSIPTNIVNSQHFQKIVENTNISQILTETDAPYLSPFKEKLNEPSFIVESIKKIAEIKGLEKIEVENNIFMNYQKKFM